MFLTITALYKFTYLLGVKIFPNFWKSNMADGRHLKKSKNGHISATAWPICTKFGTVTHIGTEEYRYLKFWSFKNPRWRTTTILKNRKPVIYSQRLDRLARYLALWYMYLPWEPYRQLTVEFLKIWDAGRPLLKLKNRHISAMPTWPFLKFNNLLKRHL